MKHFAIFLLTFLPAFAGAQVDTGTASIWNYAPLGGEAGRRGVFPLETGNGREIFWAATGGSPHWQALRYDPVGGDYRIIHSSFPATAFGMVGFHAAQASGDAVPELIAGHSDGTIAIYDATSRELVSLVRPLTEMSAFLPFDLDGNGVIELICLTHGLSTNRLIVFDLNGVELWRLDGAGGFQLTAGQMDGDPQVEIATSSGKVVDSSTRSMQWELQGGSWSYLVVSDIDNDGMGELLVSGQGNEIRAYDVDIQTTKWSHATGDQPDGLLLSQIDTDPELELIHSVEEGLEAMDLSAAGAVSKWKLSNPDRETMGIAVADLDGNGNPELVWSTRDNSVTRLRFFDIPTLLEKWIIKPFGLPMVGMFKGDVTGDRVPEYVFASKVSIGDVGQIQVIDVNTLLPMGRTNPMFGKTAIREILDLSRCDIDGDGRFEIAVSGYGDRGLTVEIFRFDPLKGFDRIWTTPENFSSNSGVRTEVADVDGNGDLEVVIAAARREIGRQSQLFVFDFDSGIEQWRSPTLPGNWFGPLSLAVSDVDADGRIEAVMGCMSSGFEVYDLELKAIERTVSFPALTCVASRVGQHGIEVGTANGRVARFSVDEEGFYVSRGETVFTPGRIEQLIPAFGDSLFSVADKRISLHGADGSVEWRTVLLPGQVSQRLSPLHTVDGWELFTNLPFGGSIFPLESVDDETVVDVFSTGALREGGTAGGIFLVSRHKSDDEDLQVRFTLSGTAEPGTDYQVVGATNEGNGSWQTVIPAGGTAAAHSRQVKPQHTDGQ